MQQFILCFATSQSCTSDYGNQLILVSSAHPEFRLEELESISSLFGFQIQYDVEPDQTVSIFPPAGSES